MSIKAPKKRVARVAPALAPAVHGSRAPFAELVDDQHLLAKVTIGLETIISESFMPGKNPVRDGVPTQAHVRERFAICARWFRTLRKDKLWGVNRILDSLPRALHAELNGNTWEPDDRACWVPSDGK